MNKIITIIIIIFTFCAFFCFETDRKSKIKILKVLDASTIQADINHNGVLDNNETICIPELDTFTSNLNKNQDELSKKYGLNFADSIKFGYLSDNFAENLLSDKLVKLKYYGNNTADCNYADININNESYKKKLYITGYAFEKGKASPQFKTRLEQAKKLNLVILNHRSNKYHTLDCEYGLAARDSVIIPYSQVTKELLPCKYCHHVKSKMSNTEEKTYPLVITEGNLKIYLTDFTTKLKPDRDCSSLVCKELLQNINSTKESIDAALYGWDDIPVIYNAILSAQKRGVKLRIVYDVSKNSYYPDTQKLTNIADESKGDGKTHLMHNKFMIFDNQKIITGSMNFSGTGLSGFNTNCIFLINSKEIAQKYKSEFEQMLNGKFKGDKSKLNIQTFQINNIKITPLFSPKDKITTNYIIPLLNKANNYIYIPAFIITHNQFTNTLIKAKERGVDVKIIIDATTVSSSKSKIKSLRDKGIQVKTEDYAGKMHSKSIIIDDKYIISGSMNFTNSGENFNDENSLIIESPRLAIYYKRFFEYLWKKIPDKYLQHNVKPESKYSVGSCFDGIDNDYDGKIDMQDSACQ